jgi:Tol biopolymer transport system component
MNADRIFSLVIPVFAVIILVGCSGGNNSNSGSGNSSHTLTVTLTATPKSTTTGAPVTLAWSATNAASVSIDNGVGTVSTNVVGTASPSESGTVTVYPFGTTTWTATATAGMGSTVAVTATATVNVTSNSDALILYYAPAYNNSAADAVWVVESNGTGAVQIASGVFNPAWFADHQSFIAVDSTAAAEFHIFTTNGSATSTKLQSTISLPPFMDPGLPTPSPDGKTIVFVGFSSATFAHQGIYTVNADGTGLTTTPLYQNPNGGSGLALDQPRWSHDGKYIVHDRVDTSGHMEIWVMNADGSNVRQVTNNPSVNSSSPAFSVDDKTIFFDRCTGGVCQIWKIASDGTPSTETLLVNNALGPVPSPDGKSLVYLGFTYGETIVPLFVSDVNGNNPQQIVANGYDPSW